MGLVYENMIRLHLKLDIENGSSHLSLLFDSVMMIFLGKKIQNLVIGEKIDTIVYCFV